MPLRATAPEQEQAPILAPGEPPALAGGGKTESKRFFLPPQTKVRESPKHRVESPAGLLKNDSLGLTGCHNTSDHMRHARGIEQDRKVFLHALKQPRSQRSGARFRRSLRRQGLHRQAGQNDTAPGDIPPCGLSGRRPTASDSSRNSWGFRRAKSRTRERFCWVGKVADFQGTGRWPCSPKRSAATITGRFSGPGHAGTRLDAEAGRTAAVV